MRFPLGSRDVSDNSSDFPPVQEGKNEGAREEIKVSRRRNIGKKCCNGIARNFQMHPEVSVFNTILFLNIFKKAEERVIMKTVMRNETFSNNRSGI